MRTTITIDDALLKKARDFSGIEETPELVREGLRSLISREAARRLILLGGTVPNARDIPRRRLK